ncbi:MAG: carboxypeptidase-like regulatory domain-containing protein [Ferruginibacter sp.]|nr:carboxypeptidase-like regulatory domain-containing protein [Ferruginibacter sp.]
MRTFLLLFFIFLSVNISAQKIWGTVFNDKGELLPYSSITVKGTTIGASANNRARFSIALAKGTYTVVCQHIGYAAKEKEITITNQDEEISFVLAEQKLVLKEVLVKNTDEDPAYAIIRSAIKKREGYGKEVSAFTCDLYTKDMMKLRKLPKKIFGRKLTDESRQDMGVDTMGQGIIYLSESISTIATVLPDKFKMEVKSSRVSGSGGFGFTFPTFISFYQNNVTVFTERLNPRGFVSPIADGAISYYRFKFLGSFWENGKEINSIRVTPRRNYEPLFSGVINITEGDWRIHSADLLLTKKSQLEIIDTLQITQFHVPVNNEAWRIKNQLLHFSYNQFGIDAVANFVSVYSNYNLQPVFAKKYFDKVIIKYDTGVNKKPKTYWDTIRPMPLEKEEIKDYRVKDSLYELRKDSMLSRQSIDSLKKKQGKLKPYQVFWSGINRTHYSNTNQYRWGIGSLIQKLEYNPAEGVALNASGFLEKVFKKTGHELLVRPNIRYGLNNMHLNAWVDIGLRTRDLDTDERLRRHAWNISGGKRVTQFNKESPITPLINSINTLFFGDNFMKTYENIFTHIGYSKRFENGLHLNVNALYEDRIPLNNTTKYTFFKKDSVNITPNYPFEKISATEFTRHQAVLLSIDISIKPGQKFIQFPNRKISIGSKIPTFSINYTRGFNGILSSDVNFDKWRFTIFDDKNFKLAGTLKYKIGVGGFINRRSVFIPDYQHFNGNRSLAASEYLNSFQLAAYYANSTIASFYSIVHLDHHLNGLLTNKIPVFNRLNWNLVVGGNAFIINENNNYSELFVGLENILKIFRVDFVWAFQEGRRGISGFRIGTGGLIGASVKRTSTSGGSGGGNAMSF